MPISGLVLAALASGSHSTSGTILPLGLFATCSQCFGAPPRSFVTTNLASGAEAAKFSVPPTRATVGKRLPARCILHGLIAVSLCEVVQLRGQEFERTLIAVVMVGRTRQPSGNCFTVGFARPIEIVEEMGELVDDEARPAFLVHIRVPKLTWIGVAVTVAVNPLRLPWILPVRCHGGTKPTRA